MSMLKAKVNAALEKIGKTNGTAPGDSQDPLDAVAHEYNVAAQIESYGKKRKELAKATLVSANGIGENALATLDQTIAGVKKQEISDTITLAKASNHTVTAQVKIGASYLDIDSLRVELKKKFSTAEVEAMVARHTKRRAPSVTYVIGELGDG